MRLIIVVALSLFAGVSLAKPLKVSGVNVQTDKKVVYLYDFIGSELFIKDSTEVSKGSFQFKLKNEETPVGIYAVGFSNVDLINIVLNDEDVVLSKPQKEWGVLEGNDSKEIQKYIKHLADYDNTLMQIETEYRKILPLQQASPQQFQEQFEPIRKKLDSLNTGRVAFFKSLHDNTSSAFTRKVASIFLMDENSSKLTYFKTTDFTDEELTRGLILEKKINMYFMSFVSINQQNIESEFKAILSLSSPKSRGKQVAYLSLVKIAASVNPEYCRELYRQMKTVFGDDKMVTRVKQYVPKGAPVVGDIAPEIVLPNADGKIMKLSDLKGKVVLLDFWASWCGPCRREMPNVVNAYDKYKEKGFTVYSVSLDSDKNRWLSAIQADGMVWDTHVSELKKWDSDAAREYFVRGIPATFLIDADGVIIGKNLRGPALHSKLEELMAN